MVQTKRKYKKRSSGKRAKQKGRGFEAEVAKLFTKWSGLEHRRVPQSGGWDKKIVCGDVICRAEYESVAGQESIFVPFTWECKKREGWDFVQLFKDDEKCPLHLWWEQASGDSKKVKKLPALIFSRNYLPIFIMIGSRTANRLTRLTGRSWKEFTHMVHPITKKEQVVVLVLDDFLDWVPFQTLLKLTV